MKILRPIGDLSGTSINHIDATRVKDFHYGLARSSGSFHRPGRAFSFGCRRATQLEVDISGFPRIAAHFTRTQERPGVKKLLAYEKEVNEWFAKMA
jgi:hypothetical protein